MLAVARICPEAEMLWIVCEAGHRWLRLKSKQPSLAPHDAGVGCYRGDTTTGFGMESDAEFAVAAIHKIDRS
jgi:hypothetical protein